MPLWLLLTLLIMLLPPLFVCAGVCICARRPIRRAYADCIIVLGAKVHPDGTLSTTLRRRCDTALKLYHEQAGLPLILCGGQGRDERQSEASAMSKYMLSSGVPRKHIILEGESSTSYQNLENAKILMYAHDLHCAYIVTSNYHLTRAMWLARDMGMSVGGVPAPGPDKKLHIIKTRCRESVSWCLYFLDKTGLRRAK